MSNVALFNPSNVPAFARAAGLSDVAKALAGNGGGGGKRISIKGGVFRLMADGKQVAAIDERYLDVVVVKAAAKVARVFYMGTYDKDAPATAPNCWSTDGDKPDAGVKNAPSQTCASCPNNVAGSGQGQSRACRYQQRLAVVLASDIEGDVMQLPLPATSIFGKSEGDNHPLQAYARWLVAQSVDPSTVVTRMKFDTTAESPKLFFKAMRWLTDEEYATAAEKGKSAEAINAVAMNVSAMDGVKPAPLNLGGSKPKAAPAVEEEEEAPAPAPKKAAAKPKVEEPAEEPAEPSVRKAETKPTSVPAKKSLADVVSGWDDED